MAISTMFRSMDYLQKHPEKAGKLGQRRFGYYQYLQGLKQKEELERPTYEIPAEVQQNLTQAQMMALEGLPAEQKKQFVENTLRGTTARLRGISDRRGGLVGVEQAGQAEADAYRTLLGMDVGARQQNIQNLMGQREKMAERKDLAWQINQMQPYLQQYGEAQGLIGAGIQNTMAAKQANKQIAFDLLGQGIGAAGTVAGAKIGA